MLDIKYIVQNKNKVIENLNRRGGDYSEKINIICTNYKKYTEILQKEEELKALINKKSKEIGLAKRNNLDTTNIVVEVENIKKELQNSKLKKYKEIYEKELLYIPNLLDESVPLGKDDSDNIEVKKWGDIPNFSFPIKEHYEISSVKNDFDFDKAAQITKSRFVITKNFVARLERALSNFMLDTHTIHGYNEVSIPYLISDSSFQNSGQLPKFKFDAFKIDNNSKEENLNLDDEVLKSKKEFYLISTAEAILANLHQNEILDFSQLPLKYTAYSQCFRKEVGSGGKDVTGLIRMHQFGKVELFKYVKPEDSEKALNSLVEDAERILKELELPYRVVKLCSGDVGFTAQKTYDLEVWFPAQNKYRECSSCSNVGDFQARRGKIRYKNENGKKQYPHMLNGSGMATGRILAALLENNQQEDGTIRVPEKLLPYIK